MCYKNGTGYRCECCGKEPKEISIVTYGVDGSGNKERISPVLMIAVTPGKTMEIITELEAEKYLPGFEYEDEIAEVPEVGLVMSYEGEGIFQIGDRYYLDKPFLIYNLDEDGELISVSAEDIYAVQEVLKSRTVLVRQDGEEMSVIDLN